MLACLFHGHVEKLAGGRAGADEQDVDAVAGKLGSQRIGQAVEGEFAGAVLAFLGTARCPRTEPTLTMIGRLPARSRQASRMNSAGAKS